MKIFISWSGERSRKIAEALRDWLPNVIQSVEPWMSSEDIAKGTQWARELTDELSETNFGIICLTPENLDAPWLLFEAGALSKTIKDANVSPFLFELKPADVSGPLAIYQFTQAVKEDTAKLVGTINAALKDGALPEDKVQVSFEKWWSDLEDSMENIPTIKKEDETEPRRNEREILEEILGLVRNFGSEEKVAQTPIAFLSLREFQILRLFEENPKITINEYSKELGLSRTEVRSLITRMYRKFELDSVPEVLEYVRTNFDF